MLAGGHAIAEHGILQRPSEDVDLFADWQRRADFPAAVDEVVRGIWLLGMPWRSSIAPRRSLVCI
nr:hypothetical protein [Catenuloplanes atrovinosus]